MKRASDHQLTKDDAERGDDEAPATAGSFEKASPEVLATRRILKVRRSLPSQTAPDEAKPSNPFAPVNATAPPAGDGDAAKENEKPQVAALRDDAARPDAENGDSVADGKLAEKTKPSKSAPIVAEKPAETGTATEKPTTVEKPAEPSSATEPEKPAIADKPEEQAAVARPTGQGLPEKVAEHAAADMSSATETPASVPKADEPAAAAPVLDGAGKKDAAVAGDASQPVSTGEAARTETEKTETEKTEAPAVAENPAKDDAAAPSESASKTDTPAPVNAPLAADASAAHLAAKDGAAKANGETFKAPISFGGVSGSASALTFAHAAAADNGSFNFKPSESAPHAAQSAPQKEFKEAQVETGEEQERELFRARAKLYSLEMKGDSGRWRERGVGSLKLNRHLESGKVRLLMRTEATLRVVLNTPIFAGIKLDRATERSLRFQGFDVDNADGKNRTSFLVRFATRDIASGFVEAIENCKKSEDDN